MHARGALLLILVSKPHNWERVLMQDRHLLAKGWYGGCGSVTC
jgi:hypothetical protein